MWADSGRCRSVHTTYKHCGCTEEAYTVNIIEYKYTVNVETDGEYYESVAKCLFTSAVIQCMLFAGTSNGAELRCTFAHLIR